MVRGDALPLTAIVPVGFSSADATILYGGCSPLPQRSDRVSADFSVVPALRAVRESSFGDCLQATRAIIGDCSKGSRQAMRSRLAE